MEYFGRIGDVTWAECLEGKDVEMKKKVEKKTAKAKKAPPREVTEEEEYGIEITSGCRIMPSLEEYKALPKFWNPDKSLTDVEQLQMHVVELREMIEELTLRVQELEWALVPEKRVISSTDFFWDPEIFERAEVTEQQMAKHLAHLLKKASAKPPAKAKKASAKKPKAKKTPAKKAPPKPKAKK